MRRVHGVKRMNNDMVVEDMEFMMKRLMFKLPFLSLLKVYHILVSAFVVSVGLLNVGMVIFYAPPGESVLRLLVGIFCLTLGLALFIRTHHARKMIGFLGGVIGILFIFFEDSLNVWHCFGLATVTLFHIWVYFLSPFVQSFFSAPRKRDLYA